jgi:hypothetical protein
VGGDGKLNINIDGLAGKTVVVKRH